MIRRGDKILSLIFILLFLASCSTKRKAVITPVDAERMEFVFRSPAVMEDVDCLSGNVKFTADFDGSAISTRGTLRIKANDGIQIGLTALGLVEVACLEFLPENARMIYKLGKEYADVPYSQVTFLQETGIDYKILEAALLNKMFFIGDSKGLLSFEKMHYGEDGNCITAETSKIKGFVYKFFVDKSTGNLVRIEGTHDGGAKVVCRYADFALLGNRPYPRIIELKLIGTENEVTLQFAFLRINNTAFDFVPRAIPSSYGKTGITELLKSLENN